MYQENRSFHTPEKPLTVWRYIDFTKFVDMLFTSQLYFTRSDKFEDPFEGVFRSFTAYGTCNQYEVEVDNDEVPLIPNSI